MIVQHGGNLVEMAKKSGYALSDCLDFSANINPFGVSKALKHHLIQSLENVTHYPDIHYQKARAFLAAYHSQEEDRIVLSNGAVELFYDLARFFRPKRVLTLSPTFLEYEKAFKQVGSHIESYVLHPPHYQWSFETIVPSFAYLAAGDVVLLCNPNNPTGTLVSVDILRKVAIHLREKEILLVIDEAFLDFLKNQEKYTLLSELKEFPNVVLVRSLTKFYAIPGLRLGYLITYHPTCIQGIQDMRAPWTVNHLAESSISVMLHDKEYIERTRCWLGVESDFLYQALSQFPDLAVLKPTVNYIFFEYKGKGDLKAALWQEKILIRSCYNYPHLTTKHYRVAIRSHEENERLVQALRTLLQGSDNETS